jgi:cellulose synthase/poly-beta-1,6-N-acetylglucosamine synthase-like glycosyltransferase
MARIKRISVGIGIFCHNEEENIESAILSVLSSQTEVAMIKKIIVVSSGSFDRTNRIVRKFLKKEPRLILIDEAERRGKSAAINLFLARVKAEVLITLSGDLRVRKDSIEEMVVPFLNQEVGMVGGHPVPKNPRFSAVGKEMSMLWELHHLVSLKQPKCGEMVAFRNVIQKIPAHSAVDEATLEVLLRLIGFSVVYAPRAIVYNKVPRTLAELIRQRRRVEAGHLWVKETYNYTVSTMNTELVARNLLALVADKPSRLKVALRLLIFEAIAKGLGWFDYAVLRRNPYIWDMVSR